ncbi:MAG: zinc ribbon domain-containing protein [Bacteroidaceae bacterium]|nr:zinc ribbon domain-containing protein [Bacteroidaceae bacterium]
MAIINCPGCGKNISSMAFTCPHCGIRLRNEIRCGRDTAESAAQPDNAPVLGDAQLPDETETKPQKKKNGCLKSIIIMLIAAMSIGAILYAMYRYHERQAAERRALMEELAKRIMDDQKANTARLHLAQQDSILWKKVLKHKTIETTEEYIQTYPEGIFIDEAYMLLEEQNRRIISKQECHDIRSIIDSQLVEYRDKRLRTKDRDIRGMHYNIAGELDITKKYINRDSFQYVVRGTITETINRTDPTKPNNLQLELDITMDADKRILQSNLQTAPELKQ